MSYTIETDLAVGVVWNDDASEWELRPETTQGGLDWARPLEVVSEDDEYDDAEIWPLVDRARDQVLTTEDLAHMLGSALAQTVREHNKYVEHRPASPALIGMLKDKISESVGLKLLPIDVASIVQAILPIVSSVDQNAHLRGVAEGRTLPIPVEVDGTKIRVAISDAYYDARNAGKTMDAAADTALAGVLAILGVDRG